jgi:pyridoxamine 5'-phosphate oxidase
LAFHELQPGSLSMMGPVSGEILALFRDWLAEAEKSEPSNATACALATVDPDGQPSVRMVLLKGADERGFVFYTNLESRKAVALAAEPRAALCFHWKSLARQVRIDGAAEAVSAAEADAYFASRDRASQLGAWASQQSRPLRDRAVLEAAVAAVAARHPAAVPRPPHWSGFRLVPNRVEFWRERPARLHERIDFLRGDGGWTRRLLFP